MNTTPATTTAQTRLLDILDELAYLGQGLHALAQDDPATATGAQTSENPKPSAPDGNQ